MVLEMLGLRKKRRAKGKLHLQKLSPRIVKVSGPRGKPYKRIPERVARLMGGSERTTINISYDDLVKILGEPTWKNKNLNPYSEGGDKVRAEWIILVEGIPIRIYDYKSDVPLEKETRWSIGARAGNDEAVKTLINYIKGEPLSQLKMRGGRIPKSVRVV